MTMFAILQSQIIRIELIVLRQQVISVGALFWLVLHKTYNILTSRQSMSIIAH